MVSKIVNIFTSLKWGEWCLISLYISVISGVVVAFQYNPLTPVYSSSSLDLLVPYGEYFRSLHFYSSQLFFLFSIIHLIAVYPQTNSYPLQRWFKLIASLPVALLVLFTGYVLRGDTTGNSAGLIAENILLSIPLVGEDINSLLFSISENGLKRIYINHIITLGILWGALLWNHLRRYRVGLVNNFAIISLLLLFCLLIPAPFDPDALGIFHISGPWFFLGLQELLRFFPPFLAGVIIPLSLIFALLTLRRQTNYFKPLLFFICFWLSAYSILTAIALTRAY